ncbi:MAG TPA: hypothetical protein VGF10_12270 [Gaiella sp.]|jgi:hypothetical protein
MRALLALGVLLTIVAAGCGGTEDPTQRYARDAIESHLARNTTYDLDHVRCTGNPRPWFVERQTAESICAVRRAAGGCDWFRVELVPIGSQVSARVELRSQDAGCSPT